MKKGLRIVAIAALAYLAIASGMILSQSSIDRTDAGGLDFSRQAKRRAVSPAELLSYTAADGETLYYRRYSSGDANAPLLVLIHGSGWHGLVFDGLAREIARRKLADVVAPDLRGHGRHPIRRGDIDHIGQFEDDLHALALQERRDGQNIVIGGHSSGGGLAIRYAGGPYGDELSAAILLAPFLKYNAPTARPESGGWARPLTRRIIGLTMLNMVGVDQFNHLTVLDFAFPSSVLDGPLGATATQHYSYRLNRSFAPRSDYLGDVARLPRFLLIAGAEDEAFVAKNYEPTMRPATDRGTYVLLPGVSHLDVVDDGGAIDAISDFLQKVAAAE